jgi:hypothetical protein
MGELRKPGIEYDYSPKELKEMMKCMKNQYYFYEHYFHIKSNNKITPFIPYSYQKTVLDTVNDNRFIIVNYPRQAGKSVSVVAYITWCVLFKKNYDILICSRTEDAAIEMLNNIKLALENIPFFLQQGILKNDAKKISFENKSSIKVSATTESAGRSGTYSLVMLDEFAFIESGIAESFYSAVYPTVTSVEGSKIIIISTPNGLNLFYKIFSNAQKGKNSYKALTVHWSEKPGRDQAWADQTIKDIGVDKFETEYGCAFSAAQGSLISTSYLKSVQEEDPIFNEDGLSVFEYPQPNHRYVICVDCSEGIGKDASVASVIDVTEKPYKFVAKYRSNTVHIFDFPIIIQDLATRYNMAYVFIEVGSGTLGIGAQVATTMYYELEYPNMIFTTSSSKTKSNQMLALGPTDTSKLGVKTTESVKSIGCVNLKNLIENDDFIFADFELKQELSVFVKKGNSFAAEIGETDDIVMTCVLFGWLVKQTLFELLTDTSVQGRESILKLDTPQVSLLYDNGNTDGDQFALWGGDVWECVGTYDFSMRKVEKEYTIFDSGYQSGGYIPDERLSPLPPFKEIEYPLGNDMKKSQV